MIWVDVSWFSAQPIVALKRRITAKKYGENLACQVHPMMQTLFPAGYGIFQNDNASIHAAELVQSWSIVEQPWTTCFLSVKDPESELVREAIQSGD
ncbi:DDE_3 domain-containing protein [Trichonephila clavipes]|nr:DDE_3 domain-containing protein [Trichonephila clavipes]